MVSSVSRIHTLKDTEKNTAHDAGACRSLGTTTDGERGAGKEAGDNRVPWVFLLADRLDTAVERGEKSTPDTKVTTENRRARLDGRHGAEEPLATRRVAGAFDAMPNCATNAAHGERTTEVVQNDPRAGVTRVVLPWVPALCNRHSGLAATKADDVRRSSLPWRKTLVARDAW